MKQNIGYVLGIFPNLTETFVLREIEGLQGQEFDVRVFAVKRPLRSAVERSMYDTQLEQRCIYAKPDNVMKHLWENLRAFVVHPRRYLVSLWRILQEAPRLEPPEFMR